MDKSIFPLKITVQQVDAAPIELILATKKANRITAFSANNTNPST